MCVSAVQSISEHSLQGLAKILGCAWALHKKGVWNATPCARNVASAQAQGCRHLFYAVRSRAPGVRKSPERGTAEPPLPPFRDGCSPPLPPFADGGRPLLPFTDGRGTPFHPFADGVRPSLPSSDGPNADKRKGVLLLLADAERSQWSDGEIAPARAPGARAPVAQTEGDQPGRMKSRTNSCVSRDTFRRSMPTWTGHEMAGELSLSDPQVDKRTPAR